MEGPTMDRYQPKLTYQLDGSATAGEDCGVRTAMHALDFASGGKVRTSKDVMRRRMHKATGPTSSQDIKAGIESFGAAMKKEGLRPAWMHRFEPSPFADARRALEDGKAVVVQANYGVVNRQQRAGRVTDLSGDHAFMGSHSVLAIDIDQRGDGAYWKILDPLCDGRRSEIPTGPRWWPEWLVRRAAAKMDCVWGRDADGHEIHGPAGRGRITGGIVGRARTLTDPETDTDEHQSGGPDRQSRGDRIADLKAEKQALKVEIAALKEELTAAEEEVDWAARRISELEGALGMAAAIPEADSGTSADDAQPVAADSERS